MTTTPNHIEKPKAPIGAATCLSLADCAREAGVSRRFLEHEITRGRLVPLRLSVRIVRIRRREFERYLESTADRSAAPAAGGPVAPTASLQETAP